MLTKLEKLLRDLSRKIPGMCDLNYSEGLRRLRMNSIQRRLEQYQTIYCWKIMDNQFPNCCLSDIGQWTSHEERTWGMGILTPLKIKEKIDEFLIPDDARSKQSVSDYCPINSSTSVYKVMTNAFYAQIFLIR